MKPLKKIQTESVTKNKNIQSSTYSMKTTLYILCLFQLSFQLCSIGQNLIPDPGFELMQKIPNHDFNGIRCTKNWVNATTTNGDYYNNKAKSSLLGVGVPRNVFGYQKPKSGDGYAGICIQKDMKEYVETNLTAQLIKGQKYLIEFFISRAENRHAYVKEFGVLFSDKIQTYGERTGLAIKPDIDFINKDGYKVTKNWIKLSATYTAMGFETVLIVGHFNYDKKLSVNGKAHYYIDEVSITKVDDDTIFTEEVEKKDLTKKVEKDSIKELFTPELGKIITLKDILFSSNKSEIEPISFEELNKLSDYLLSYENTFIQINGHTDNSGNEEENKKLSESRAKSVADYLISRGIEMNRIKFYGDGSEKPIEKNNTEEGKRKNRRVEFIIKEK